MHTPPPPLLLVAALASVGAGMIHAAAAGSHAELATLSTMFSIFAVAQIGWAGAAVLRGGRAVIAGGIAINLVALGAWTLSRTVGLSAVEGLEAGQAIGFQDALAAGLAAVAAVAALTSLTAVEPSRVLGRAVPVLAAAVLVAAVPAMATPHDHGTHDHDDVAGDGELAAADDPAPGDTDAHDDSHDDDAHDDDAHDDSHDDDDSHHDDDVAVDEDLPYPASFASFLDEAETPKARQRAEELIVGTTEAMQAFPDEAAVQAAGFTSIGDGGTGWEHYIHVERIMNPTVLDPSDIESIVLKVHPDGTKEVASAMYLLPFGTTMADVPDIAGDLTEWHDHQNLCWEGARVVGTTDATGACTRGAFRPTQPMLHVWVIEHECGPFAGIEGSHGSGCGSDHDH